DAVARRFYPGAWRRGPLQACKHVHAARWHLGDPTQEPAEAVTPGNAYWSDPGVMGQMEEMIFPLQQEVVMERIRRLTMHDQTWRDLDALPLTVSAADAVCSLNQEVPLLRLSSGYAPGNAKAFAGGRAAPDLLVPLTEFSRDLAEIEGPGEAVSRQAGRRMEPKAALPASAYARFGRTWPLAHWRDAERAILGDVWMGVGNTRHAYPYEGPQTVADTPFVTPRDDVVPVLP
ncbi:MAG: hypothetical protein WBM08_07270, partial [Prochlorococcaceae cyanobacterium]